MKKINVFIASTLAIATLIMSSFPVYAATTLDSEIVEPMTMIVTETLTSDKVVSAGGGSATVRVSVKVTYDAQRDKIISVSNATAYQTGVSIGADWETLSVSATKDDYTNVYVDVEGQLRITYINVLGQTVSYTEHIEFTTTFSV